MKVVIFCGGFGVRMGEETQRIPKPMVRIGNRPILWHIMRYYADWGHKEFILCLGYKGDSVKEYFLTHNEALTNDFVLEGHGADARVELLTNETADWRITFVDTGLSRTIGGRLQGRRAVHRRRRGVPRHLRRRADRRIAAGPDRRVPGAGPDGDVPVGEAAVQRAPDRDRARRHGDADRGSDRLGRADQRRLLRLQARDPRLDRAGRRARRRDVRAPDPARARWSRIATTGSGGRWTRSRTGRASRRCTSRATRPGSSARTERVESPGD